MKKPLTQRKWFWFLLIVIFSFCYFEVKDIINSKENEARQVEIEKNAKKVLATKVEVPDTYLKTKEEVKELFNAAGISPKFVVANFDEKASSSEHFLRTGECDEINIEQPGIEYFDTDDVGDKFGFYVKKGSTIIVGYSDHDFNGTKDEKASETSSDKNKSSDSTESSEKNINEINKDWYTSDSKYATMEPVKKTVEMQMEEIDTEDPVKAILVNDIQTYLFGEGESLEVTEINRNLEYTRLGMYIDIKINNAEPTPELSKEISNDLLNISGHVYTIE